MNIYALGEAVEDNEEGDAIDLWALTDHFGAGRGKELVVMYCPTADYDGTLQLQTATDSDFTSPTSLGSALSGTGALIKKLSPTERYLRRKTTSASAGSMSVYLLGSP